MKFVGSIKTLGTVNEVAVCDATKVEAGYLGPPTKIPFEKMLTPVKGE